MFCSCKENEIIEVIGLCDGSNINVTTDNSWTEISIPEIIKIPNQKPDIESVEKVFESVKIISKRIVVTPSATVANAEGTKLAGKKLVLEGLLNQKIVYTADTPDGTQPVHSADFCFPFSAFIVIDGTATDPNQFCIDVCVEDVFIRPINSRKLFKNVTLLLNARKVLIC